MSMPEDRILDDPIRNSMSDTVPPEVERRLRAQLAGFRSRLSASEPAVAYRAPRWTRPAWWGLSAACAALMILMAVAALVLRPRTSFAQVATAVLKQPWVHMRFVRANESVGEQWFSPAKDVLAFRRPDSIEYRDYRLQVYYSYDLQEKVLYRGPTPERIPLGDPEGMTTAIKVLLQQERPLDQPLAHLGFLGPERETMKVLDQMVEKVTDQGRAWLDYRLTVTHARSTQPLRMMFRVDAATKLPRLSRMEGQWDGQVVTMETQFGYPEKGPTDIYDLGVPKTAKLVDRVPTGDLQRILETLKAGRERMDNYRAVFVNHTEGIDYHWWTDRPLVFYRKGSYHRADYVGGWTDNLSDTKRPAKGEDLHKWWFERIKFSRSYPQYVLRDSTSYSTEIKPVKDPDGSEHQDIVSVQKIEYNLKPGEMVPVEYSMRPEFACRPPMGIGNQDLEPSIDMHPAEGPKGCILLTVRHTSTKGRIDEKGVGTPDGNRYWLDPERDYIVMRCDMVHHDGTGKEFIIESDLTEETARSPQGVWYATKIRRKNAGGKRDGKPLDQVYHIYIDFNADLPDSLFEPPTPRRLY